MRKFVVLTITFILLVSTFEALFVMANADLLMPDLYASTQSNDFAYYGGFHTFFATSNSPIKTSRGIVIGSKKSTVKAQYGLPTLIKQGSYNGKTYEYYYYEGSHFYILFAFQKSKDTVDYMSYSYQND